MNDFEGSNGGPLPRRVRNSTPGPLTIAPSGDGHFVVKAQPHPGMRGFIREIAVFEKEGDAEAFVSASRLMDAVKSIVDAYDYGGTATAICQAVKDHIDFMRRQVAAQRPGDGEGLRPVDPSPPIEGGATS